MDLDEKIIRDALEIVREYRVTRDEMVSPLNLNRATHIQFITMCNERAHRFHGLLPTITYDETLHLYRLAAGDVPGWRADRMWAEYTEKDREALMELLGLTLGIIRQART